MGLTDLDDLVNRCIDPGSKAMLKEAVACYHAGAYRACIVSTWIAVVFDFIAKLNDLSVSGNGEAKALVEQLESARRSEDIPTSLKFENSLVKTAEKFDLLAPVESTDLERLKEDRHRCAHPSQIGPEEPYMPSAELARGHIFHAVNHLLARRPVQGQRELDRIWKGTIESVYFDEERAEAALRSVSGVVARGGF